MACISSVSYTHLDVYKRQVYHSFLSDMLILVGLSSVFLTESIFFSEFCNGTVKFISIFTFRASSFRDKFRFYYSYSNWYFYRHRSYLVQVRENSLHHYVLTCLLYTSLWILRTLFYDNKKRLLTMKIYDKKVIFSVFFEVQNVYVLFQFIYFIVMSHISETIMLRHIFTISNFSATYIATHWITQNRV